MKKNNYTKKYVFITFTLVLALLLGIGIYAVTQQTTTFVSQANPFNITLQAGINNTQYIDIPMGVYIKNITLQIQALT